ncbi:hypothetical protein [Acinetobacter baumannii]|nr:hypothetical protein [Acinetobacter baumannii]UEL55136.1 hypothetical protein JWB57_20120 [Acinetobacter baumannii]
MINLVCGQPRNGKSQFMVKTILDMLEENKKLEEQGKRQDKFIVILMV